MTRCPIRGFLQVMLCACAVHPTAGCAADRESILPVRVVADVLLPGSTSRFDYADLDSDRHLLFLAHMGADEVLVFDTAKQAVMHTIKNVSDVHGVLVIPSMKRVYASATGSNEIVAIDEGTAAIIARMPGGRYPDGMAYAPDAHKLYVSDEAGATETVINVQANERLATIPLGGEVGNTQYDPVSNHVFVNVQSRQQLIEIDPATDKIIARNDIPGAKGNHGLLIQAKERLALIACEDNDKLIVFDLAKRQVTQTFDVGSGPDVLAGDPALGLIYVATESGTVSLFRLEGRKVVKLADGFLAPNAHVVAVDAATHRVYFPIKNLGGKPMLRIVEPAVAPINRRVIPVP